LTSIFPALMRSPRSISAADRERVEAAILDAGSVDYLDFWFITRLAQSELGPRPPEEIREVVVQAIRQLLASGPLRAGDLEPPGDFVAWREDPAESFDRIRGRVRELDREPQVGDVAWFEVPE
jgi:hypothetical protein